MKVINLCNLSKKFRNPVLMTTNFGFDCGKTYLIVGDNGSGKTTLIKLILGLLKPTTGIIEKKYSGISYIPDNYSFPSFLTVFDFLYNLGLIYKIDKTNLNSTIYKYLSMWSLDGSKKMRELSKGMRQKVLIIQALLRNGEIFILDEPLNGLDKQMKRNIFEVIEVLKKQAKTIIIISHETNELFKLADYKLTISAGEIHEKSS